MEVEGGLYHVITSGNDRPDIFHSDEVHRKFLSLLAVQKANALNSRVPDNSATMS
jgi:hypothetical protein